MDENGGAKINAIKQIVRLKETLQRWQAAARSPPPDLHQGIAPVISKRLKELKRCDSEESCQSPEPPADVPKGYLAVYVGPELRRFIIPTAYLGHSLFKVLLEKAEEEFGFDHRGALTIPCEIETFKYLLRCIESHPKDNPDDDGISAEDSVARKSDQ